MLPSTALLVPSPPLLRHSHRHQPPSLPRRRWIPTFRRSRRPLPVIRAGILPVDPWSVDSQGVASQLFALSLFPYLGFLFFITRSNTAPKLTLFGFYFLLAFVGATIPAGIYAKLQYGTSLSNVDWLHGGAESLLTITNLFIVLGLMRDLRKIKENKKDDDKVKPLVNEHEQASP